MNTSDQQPQSLEQQRAAVEQYLADRGIEATRVPDPAESRAALDALLDDHPQLAALALDLLDTVAKHGGTGVTWTPASIKRTMRRGHRNRELAERAAMIEERFSVEQRPAAHALVQIADTRKAGEKAVASTPLAIWQADTVGMKAPDVAQLLDLTTSRVYAILRDKRAEWAVEQGVAADAAKGTNPRESLNRYTRALAGVPEGPDRVAAESFLDKLRTAVEEHERAAHEARRAQLPEGQTLYVWRLDLADSSAGKGWQTWESGEDHLAQGSEAHLAELIIEGAGEEATTRRARVLIWDGPEGTDDEAIYRHERAPEEQ
ncbi:hypothetical protein [Streptomyces sp. BPTC-684]|uniref:hypothetical protein n=1 Tax=Streptomyces sp. BPTC-684 TaxID=3043734 RepID=UPI0024B0C4FF|nr:hypothetical protein [Streptomyces sp. BPTC-684]WHM36300.1 hypothetical protein QIY60_04720 [Streptomyces sp. BPTC-684]